MVVKLYKHFHFQYQHNTTATTITNYSLISKKINIIFLFELHNIVKYILYIIYKYVIEINRCKIIIQCCFALLSISII